VAPDRKEMEFSWTPEECFVGTPAWSWLYFHAGCPTSNAPAASAASGLEK
jgi:hypothetical protein